MPRAKVRRISPNWSKLIKVGQSLVENTLVGPILGHKVGEVRGESGPPEVACGTQECSESSPTLETPPWERKTRKPGPSTTAQRRLD